MTVVLLLVSAVLLLVAAVSSLPMIRDAYRETLERAGWITWAALCAAAAVLDVVALIWGRS